MKGDEGLDEGIIVVLEEVISWSSKTCIGISSLESGFLQNFFLEQKRWKQKQITITKQKQIRVVFVFKIFSSLQKIKQAMQLIYEKNIYYTHANICYLLEIVHHLFALFH